MYEHNVFRISDRGDLWTQINNVNAIFNKKTIYNTIDSAFCIFLMLTKMSCFFLFLADLLLKLYGKYKLIICNIISVNNKNRSCMEIMCDHFQIIK